ncbi:hypothetical protein SR42_17010 [Clostridium botulinum]|uniref:hypothetical protein n=1 Tax=Clostridium botulinum TaxID=1491 RepID=UPI0005978BD8|nr:hypothetical protein [Clostridium botulinum]KIL06834.1 hypothetical protein SR42_17010 [Clostridium botulinum]MBY6934773.1 hypothetical protein [Clostridium botulinum]NFL83273.1 hypothetical protein [Clostridium botulinum]NFN11630.1 hypothetical protein [Clostridium botulinum]NFO36155.1 hypothetical protein [Clostridium botulinum]
MDRKELIEQKKKQLYFRNLMKSMNAVTTKEIYETAVEREFYKKIIFSYYELWGKGQIKPYSKLKCEANDNKLCKWIADKVELTSKKEYVFINIGYCEGYAKIVLNNLYESVLQLWYHEEKINDLYGSLKCGFGKGFCLIDLLDRKVIEVALVSDDEYNYQLWQWNY